MQHNSTNDVFRKRLEERPGIFQYKKVIIAMTVKLYPNEVILKAGDTNQCIDNVKVDGKLIVTNQRIYFKTVNEDNDRFNLEILFDNILEVIFSGKGLFASKVLNVVTRDGRTFAFPLKQRDEIGMLINKMY